MSKQKARKPSSSYYKIEGDTIVRLRKTCERCGPGYFMGDHGDRISCGKCGFTRFKSISKEDQTK